MAEEINVLVVDDNIEIVDILDDVLTKVGFFVFKAYSGREAIKLVKDKKPALVLLDFTMPKMDGFEVCKEIRKDPSKASMPILMLTARGEESSIVKMLDAGADDYLLKPADLKEVLDKVRELLAMAKEGKLPSQEYLKKKKSGS